MSYHYDDIGIGYATRRVPDRRIARQIHAALGDAESVINIGAGTGSYEPTDRQVIAVEPSQTMIAQRPAGSATVVRAFAEQLPFASNQFDSALAVLTVHHWADWRQGLAEALRVADNHLVLLTWLNEDLPIWLYHYFPEMQDSNLAKFPPLEVLQDIVGEATVAPVPIPHDCTDGFMCAYWRRPEAYLDPAVRRSISLFSMIDGVEAGLTRLENDLASGAWQNRYGSLLERETMDFGYRLITVPA